MRATTSVALIRRFLEANERIRRGVNDEEVLHLWWHDERASHEHAPEFRFDCSVIFDGALDEEFTVCTNSPDELLLAIAEDCLTCYRDGDQSHELGFTVELHRLNLTEGVYSDPYMQARYEHGRPSYFVR